MKPAKHILLFTLTLLVIPGCGMHHRAGHHAYRGTDAALERATTKVSTLIEQTVQDPDKAKQSQAVMTEIVAEVRHSRQQNRQFHRQLYELNAGYDAPPEDFLKVLDELNGRRMQSAAKILGLRFKMKALMTEEEWKAFTKGMAELRGGYRHPPGGEGKS